MSTIQEKIVAAFSQVAPPGMQAASNPFVEVIRIDSWQDFLLANLYIGGFYYALYLVVGCTPRPIQSCSSGPIPSPRALSARPPRRCRSRWA